MKTGVELIAEERQEQIEKHRRTIELDVKHNHGQFEKDGEKFNLPQLSHAAGQLIMQDDDIFRQHYEAGIFKPYDWNKEIWFKMMGKPYKERLIIAGALIAAEIDRLQALNHKNHEKSEQPKETEQIQPEDINDYFKNKKEFDSNGWTGQYSVTDKDILDFLIDFNFKRKNPLKATIKNNGK